MSSPSLHLKESIAKNRPDARLDPGLGPGSDPGSNSREELDKKLEGRQTLLADGAMGTNLFEQGLLTGTPPELWLLEQPHKVAAVHQAFLEAGARLILTNSFGANRARLALHSSENTGLTERVGELNQRAAEIARQAAQAYEAEAVLVAGSIGPTGSLFEPLGPMTHAEAKAIFLEQAQGLQKGGCDLAWIETMSSEEEALAAAQACREIGLPFALTMSFDTHGKTMMGLSPADFARFCLESLPDAWAIGGNCGLGSSDLLLALLEIRQTLEQAGPPRHSGEHPGASSVPLPFHLIAKSNCGIPQFLGSEIVYSGSPALMAAYAALSSRMGVKIIGGCCGTTQAHTAAMAAELEKRALQVLEGREARDATPNTLSGTLPDTLPGQEEIIQRARPACRRQTRRRLGQSGADSPAASRRPRRRSSKSVLG